MSTRDTLNQLVQKVGLNKAVKLLGVKGVGKATYVKIANGEIKPPRSVIGKASYATKVANEQLELQRNKEVAKKLGYQKIQKRTGEKVPTSKSSLKEIQQFNRRFSNRRLSLPAVYRMTGVSQNHMKRMMDKAFIDSSSLRYMDRQIVARNRDGEEMFLVYLLVPKYTRSGKKYFEKEWYFTRRENIEAYLRFKNGEGDPLYQVWMYDGVELHVYASDAQDRRFVA